MMFISYAQNFEDVILWRALRHVEYGFYIDVGAQDPRVHSVSRGLYEKGWRGVHIEANAQYAQKLREDRSDEEVLEFAVNREQGQIAFFEIVDTGLSTGNPEIARGHEAEGRECREVRVEAMPLSTILDRYADRDIHWLKIDVEGMEEAVLDGWPPSAVRPWVVVIESTVPNTQEPSHQAWEPKLVGLGYEFVYFDGLNRFYVSKDHAELKDAFGVGPNVFDGFLLADVSDFVPDAARFARAEAAAERDARFALEERLEAEAALREEVEHHLASERVGRTGLERELKAEREQSAALERQRTAEKDGLDTIQRQLVAELEAYAATERRLKDEEAARLSAERLLAVAEAARADLEEALSEERRARDTCEQHLIAERNTREEIERHRSSEETARTIAEHRLLHEQAEHAHVKDLLAAEMQALGDVKRELFAEQEARHDEQQWLAVEREAHNAAQSLLSSEQGARQAAERRLAFESEQRASLAARVDALTASRSWRITAPIRQIADSTRWVNRGTIAWLTLKPGSRPRRVVRRLAVGLARRILADPRLSGPARRVVGILPPRVETRLRSMLSRDVVVAPPSAAAVFVGTDVSELSARAKQFYALVLADQNDRKAV